MSDPHLYVTIHIFVVDILNMTGCLDSLWHIEYTLEYFQ